VALVVAALAVTVAAGCSTDVRRHGYAPSAEQLSALTVGVDTRQTVADTIGTPGASGVLDERGYYYVSQAVTQYGIREPEVIDREVVAISFDEAGVVRAIERFGLEAGNAVALSRNTTEDTTRGVGFLRQLLGNIGRITPDALGNAP
jgi:outer membrane protein assembly factor BamE (lipoprotein component of BamABCDE complex)